MRPGARVRAAEAGLRIGEIRGLQWTDIRDGRITIRRSVDARNNLGAPKHNKSRTVRLSSALETALAKLPRRGLWVVSKADGGLVGYWTMLEAVRKLYERAGVVIPVSETGRPCPAQKDAAIERAFGAGWPTTGQQVANSGGSVG